MTCTNVCHSYAYISHRPSHFRARGDPNIRVLTFDTFLKSLKMIAESKYGSNNAENVAKVKNLLCSSSGPSIAGTTVRCFISQSLYSRVCVCVCVCGGGGVGGEVVFLFVLCGGEDVLLSLLSF